MDMTDTVPYNQPRPVFNTWDKHNGVAYPRDIQKRDDTRDKHMSISCTKGLRNAPGENNCFLNSAVQIFWHLDVFRRSFRCLSGHACMGNSCIFCALKAIFTQFQYSDQSSLHPDVLRRALAESFVNQHRFQLGHMDDAAECFENILRRLHFHVANNHNEDMCRAPHCIPHQKFAMKVLTQVVCPCGASTEPLIFHEMVHYISATALVAQAKAVRDTGDALHPDKFGLLLRNAATEGDIRDCPGYCGKKVQMRTTLLNHPDIVSIGLVWDSERPSGNLIADVAESLGTTIMLKDVFHSVVCEDVTKLPKLNLVGLVCFYGKHYSTFIYHTKLQSWMYFDDATVREIGPNWEHVVDKCCRGRYQPLLLLYTNPNGTAISADTAPQKTVMAPEYESYATNDAYNRSSTERSHPQTHSGHFMARRELLSPFEAYDTANRLSVDHRRQASYLTAMRKSGSNKGGNNYAYDSSHDRSFDSLNPNHRKEKSGSNDSNRGSNELNSGPSGSRPSSPVAATSFFRQTPTIEVDAHTYTSSANAPLRRLSVTNTCSSPVPIVKGASLSNDVQRKESFKKGNKVRADVIRYQMNPSKLTDDEGIYCSDSNMDSVDGGRYSPPNKTLYRHDSINSDIVNPTQQQRSPSWRDPRLSEGSMLSAYQGVMINGTSSLPRRKPNTKHAMSSSVCLQNGSSPPATRIPSPYMSSNQAQAVNYQNVINDHLRQSSVNSQRSNDTALSTTQHEQQSSGSNKLKKTSDSNDNKKASGNSRGRSRHKKHEKRPRSHSVERLEDIVRYPDDPRDFIDDKIIYIDRKKVESVLSFQNHPFDPESNTHLKHLDEMYNNKVKAEKTKTGNISPLKLNIPYDNVSLESKPDSGYGSSDRNSSSSAGSAGVIDPMAQYFIRRNMIPPKNINQKAYEENMKKFLAHSVALTNSKLKPDPFKRKGPRHLSKQGRYHSKSQQNLSVADSDDKSPPTSPVDLTDLTRRSASPYIQSQHGDNGQSYNISGQSGKKPMSVNGYPAPVNGRPPPASSVSGMHNQQSSPKEHFVKMCQHVEDLMDQCVLAETTPDYPAAITYCEKAIGVFMEILTMSGLSQEHRIFAEDRQRSCIGKATNLRKICQGKSSSSNGIRGQPAYHQNPASSSDRSQPPLHQKTDSSSSSGTSRSQTPIHQKTDSSSSSSTLKNQPVFHQKTDSSSSTNTLKNQPIGNHLVQNQPIASLEADRRPQVRLGFQIRETLRVDSPVVMESRKSSPVCHQVSANYPGKAYPQYNGVQRSDSTSSWNPGQLSTSQKELQPADNGSAKTDIYGTLPKKNSRPTSRIDSSKNTEAYQTYLNHQRALNSHLEASQLHRSSVSSSYDSGGNSAHSSQSDLHDHQKNPAMPSQQHMSKAQIRQLLQQNMKKTLGAEQQLTDNGSNQGLQQQRSPTDYGGHQQQRSPTEINNHQRPLTEYSSHQQQRSPTEFNNHHLQQHRRSPTECHTHQQQSRRSPIESNNYQYHQPQPKSPTEGSICHQQQQMPTPNNGQPQGPIPQNNGHQLPTTTLLEPSKNEHLPEAAYGRYEINAKDSPYHNESFSASHKPTNHHDTRAKCRLQPNRDFPMPNHLPLSQEMPIELGRTASPRGNDERGLCEMSRNHAQRPASRTDTPDGAGHERLQKAPPTTNPAWKHLPNTSQQDTVDDSELTSVRDLRSRFENVTIYPNQTPLGSQLAPSESFLRQRSQSESSSLAANATELRIKLKKCVTFSDNISLIAASESDFMPPMSTFTGQPGTPCLVNGSGRPSTPFLVNSKEKDEEEELSDESPVDTNAPNVCALCHKNGVQFGEQYCIKCRLYMNRFKSS